MRFTSVNVQCVIELYNQSAMCDRTYGKCIISFYDVHTAFVRHYISKYITLYSTKS